MSPPQGPLPRVSLPQELNDARLWFATSMPAPAFSSTACVTSVFEALANQPAVHIIDFGAMLAFYMPRLLRQLASQAGLRPRVRVTAVDTSAFVNKGRMQWKSIRAVVEAGMRLRGLASQLGMPFEYEIVDIGENDLHLLYQVRGTGVYGMVLPYSCS